MIMLYELLGDFNFALCQYIIVPMLHEAQNEPYDCFQNLVHCASCVI